MLQGAQVRSGGSGGMSARGELFGRAAGALVAPARRWPGAVRSVSAGLPAARGRSRVLLRAPERDGDRWSDHLRPQHRLLHRSDREEAAEPVLSRQQRAFVRHGGLQSGLQVLPELDDVEEPRDRGRLPEAARPSASPRRRANRGCRSVAFTYNDPIIWAEYAIDTAKACHARGIKTVAVTSGYIRTRARGSSSRRWTPPTST